MHDIHFFILEDTPKKDEPHTMKKENQEVKLLTREHFLV